MIKMLMGVRGWAAIIAIVVFAGASTILGRMKLLSKGLWIVAALIMVHATFLKIKE